MKKITPLTGISILIALVCIIFVFTLMSRNKAAKAEILALQNQIVRMEGYVPDPDRKAEIIYRTEAADTNELAALRQQVAELQEDLEHRNRQQSDPFKERMERMKKEDPEAYAEMIRHREERREQMKYELAERTASFMDTDTSFMTEEELANHNLLIEKMNQIWELTEQFKSAEEPPDRETMRELFGTMQEARPLMEQERTVMFKQLGMDMGYSTEESEGFAGYLNDIVGATTIQPPRGGPPGMGR